MYSKNFVSTWVERLSCVGVLWAIACFSAQAQTVQVPDANSKIHNRVQESRNNPELEKKLLITGRKVAAVCANCHGPGGHSSSEEIPVLAGQNPDYLIEQARKYVDGRRRNAFMEGMLKALSVDETAGMVLYYATQVAEAHPNQPADLVERGSKYYAKICVTCHGVDGRGTAHMPRLAGQHPGYVLTALQHFRTRDGVRSSPEMEMVVRAMSEADMRAVAAYVASLP